jgi:hypothetical protein
MNAAREEQFWLTVRVSECGRRTETDGKVSRRRIELRKCPILSNSLKGENQPARGDEIDLSIYEADPGQEDIGSFDTLGILFLSLPRTTFTEFWAASAAADGAARDIIIAFKKAHPPYRYTITKVELAEHMPEAINLNPKTHALIRVHPVVAELREIRRSWAESSHGIVIALFAFIAFTLVTAITGSALQALWRWVNP